MLGRSAPSASPLNFSGSPNPRPLVLIHSVPSASLWSPENPVPESFSRRDALNHSAIAPCYTSFRSSELSVRCSEKLIELYSNLRTPNSELITRLHSILNVSTAFSLAALRAGIRPAPMEVTITKTADSRRLRRGTENWTVHPKDCLLIT